MKKRKKVVTDSELWKDCADGLHAYYEGWHEWDTTEGFTLRRQCPCACHTRQRKKGKRT